MDGEERDHRNLQTPKTSKVRKTRIYLSMWGPVWGSKDL
jgi:hypothetical protein